MGYYTPNPEERPEAPRCEECDQQMTEVTGLFFPSYWECRNPECECCPQKYAYCTNGIHGLEGGSLICGDLVCPDCGKPV